MSNILNITKKPIFDESIVKKEEHSYVPYIASFNNNDEIRISIQNQDLYVLPCESYLYIEGSITAPDGTKLKTSDKVHLNNNCVAFMFNEIRYELNGVEIDRSRNVGFTSTIKNYVSLNNDESKMLYNAGWSPNSSIVVDGFFNFCVPLKMLLGFAEDFKNIIVQARHELILTRSRTDNNVVQAVADYKMNIFKLIWKQIHINVADAERLFLIDLVKKGKPLEISFRSWHLHEYPVLSSESSHQIWSVKTSTSLERPRFIILALQTDKNNKKESDSSLFNHCNITDVKVYLNSEVYPYDDLNIMFDRTRYALLYDMYNKFQQSYYGRDNQPLLSRDEFKSKAPIVVIDCSHQNENIKSGPVDIKIEFKSSALFPANTSAYCLLLHDRIIEYNPLTNEVRKLV